MLLTMPLASSEGDHLPVGENDAALTLASIGVTLDSFLAEGTIDDGIAIHPQLFTSLMGS